MLQLLLFLLLQNPAVSMGATSNISLNEVTPTPTSSSFNVDPTRSNPFPTSVFEDPGSGSSSFNADPNLSPTPVFEDPVPTYGNNTCEDFHAGGACTDVLRPFPFVLTNLSRSVQTDATETVDLIIGALDQFEAPRHCLYSAIPLLCRYTFPTCDPAYRKETYQPICRRDCEIVRDFLCREPWQEMVRLINLLNLGYIDQPDCDPLENPEGGDSPMCISTINKDFIPLPLLTGPDCYSGRGRGYQGTVNVTRDGIPCQSWSSTSPHQHLLHLEGYTELSWDHNYCRNPGERGQRPWCFTTNESVRWDYCDMEECPQSPTCIPHTAEVCRTQGTIGKDWIFLDTGTTNIEMLAQGMNKVLDHIRVIANGFDAECAEILSEYLCISNYQPCDLSHSDPRPIQPCQQFCNRTRAVCGESIKALEAFMNLFGSVEINFECRDLPVPNGGEAPECYEQSPAKIAMSQEPAEPSPSCYKVSDLGKSYSGNISVTMTGKTCQSWLGQSPHQHPITPLDRPQLEGHNSCRNPDGRGLSPWCYTTDSNTRWEYCKVPVCSTLSLPLIYTFSGVGGGLLLLVLVFFFLCCCCCVSGRRRRKETFVEYSNTKEKCIDEPVKFVNGLKSTIKVDVSDNPLYAVNPLNQQQPVEYDGIKLPEFSRDSIFYIKDLGQGHFGVVVQAEVAHNESGTERSTVAIKVMKEGASSQVKKEFFREAMLMDNFDHPNILRLLGVCIEQEPFCMIFEFMELGDLNHLLRQNSPNKCAGSNPSLDKSNASKGGISVQQLVCLAVDIAAGLDYLAQNHFVHRDLASRNCLVSRNLRVKISDFGLSQDIYSTDYFKLGDTELLPIRWMPPEAILYAKFTTQSDVWSFGVVMWEIFSFGIQPYFSMTNEEVVQHVRDGNVMNCPEDCPQELSDLMMDCWAMNPSERPTATELHTGLQRWTPNLSVTLQNQTENPLDYQNMATIREYAQKGVVSDAGVGGVGGDASLGQFEMSIPDEGDDDIDNGFELSDDTPM